MSNENKFDYSKAKTLSELFTLCACLIGAGVRPDTPLCVSTEEEVGFPVNEVRVGPIINDENEEKFWTEETGFDNYPKALWFYGGPRNE